MWFLGEVKKNGEVIERSLISTDNDITGYCYMETRVIMHSNKKDKFSLSFVKIPEKSIAFSNIPKDINFLVSM